MTLPDGRKIASRNKARNEFDRTDYKLVCKSCGIVMKDEEPMQMFGSHTHPKTGRCIHDGQTVKRPKVYGKVARGSSWVEVFRPKKYRRERARAGKLRRSTT